MGWSLNGVCYQDTSSVLTAFSNNFTMLSAGSVVTLTVSPTITSGGLITYSYSSRDLVGGTTKSQNGLTVQLLSCSVPTVDQWPVQDYVLILGLFFAVFLGFRSGYRP